jgi:hypothetical protein
MGDRGGTVSPGIFAVVAAVIIVLAFVRLR